MGRPADAVRSAEPADLVLLARLEQAGDRLLVEALGTELPDGVTSGEARAEQPGFVLVAHRPPAGFVHVLELDGTAHLEQLVVDPAHGRRGIGAALLEAACAESAGRGHDALTLTTFRDVAFNRPFYERHGFRVVDAPVGLAARRLARERSAGLLAPRVAMVRTLAAP